MLYRDLTECRMLFLTNCPLCTRGKGKKKEKFEKFFFITCPEDKTGNVRVSKLLLCTLQLSPCALNLHKRLFKGLLDNYP